MATESVNGTPTISVIFPAYNAAAYLDEAMESLLSQTFRDLEVIAIDDGSVDETHKLLSAWAAKDPRVRVVTRENKGIPKTLNEGLALARGDFIARMDADDVSKPGRFDRQIKYLRENREVDVVGSWVTYINEWGMEIGTHTLPLAHDDIDGDHLKGHCSMVQSTVLMRAEALRRVGGYRIEFDQAEDLDLWLRLAEHGRIENIAEPLVSYRIHSASISERAGAEQRGFALKGASSAWERRGVSGTFEATEHWRPTSDRSSQHNYYLIYGWIAWNNGYRATSRHYALRALRIAPLSIAAWKLLVIAMIRGARVG